MAGARVERKSTCLAVHASSWRIFAETSMIWCGLSFVLGEQNLNARRPQDCRFADHATSAR
jgi:hypothetical protein